MIEIYNARARSIRQQHTSRGASDIPSRRRHPCPLREHAHCRAPRTTQIAACLPCTQPIVIIGLKALVAPAAVALHECWRALCSSLLTKRTMSPRNAPSVVAPRPRPATAWTRLHQPAQPALRRLLRPRRRRHRRRPTGHRPKT